jgi:hypothetical protein
MTDVDFRILDSGGSNKLVFLSCWITMDGIGWFFDTGELYDTMHKLDQNQCIYIGKILHLELRRSIILIRGRCY